jgi:ubiquitin-protein ligase
MNIRQQRLQSDRERLLDLCRRSSLIHATSPQDSFDRYIVTYNCAGLVWLYGREKPSVIREHRLDIYLHLDYPRLPPRLQWMTDIFHPNIMPPHRNGGVCIGRWSPSETLDLLVVRIGEMVQYKNFSTGDALNLEAAAWADRHRNALPVDNQLLVQSEAVKEGLH